MFLNQSLQAVSYRSLFLTNIFENLESSSRVRLRDLSVPSSIAEVSSVYCDIIYIKSLSFVGHPKIKHV